MHRRLWVDCLRVRTGVFWERTGWFYKKLLTIQRFKFLNMFFGNDDFSLRRDHSSLLFYIFFHVPLRNNVRALTDEKWRFPGELIYNFGKAFKRLYRLFSVHGKNKRVLKIGFDVHNLVKEDKFKALRYFNAQLLGRVGYILHNLGFIGLRLSF